MRHPLAIVNHSQVMELRSEIVECVDHIDQMLAESAADGYVYTHLFLPCVRATNKLRSLTSGMKVQAGAKRLRRGLQKEALDAALERSGDRDDQDQERENVKPTRGRKTRR